MNEVKIEFGFQNFISILKKKHGKKKRYYRKCS